VLPKAGAVVIVGPPKENPELEVAVVVGVVVVLPNPNPVVEGCVVEVVAEDGAPNEKLPVDGAVDVVDVIPKPPVVGAVPPNPNEGVGFVEGAVVGVVDPNENPVGCVGLFPVGAPKLKPDIVIYKLKE